MTSAESLRIKIFADGAKLASITELAGNPLIRGFTTNPTLMRAAGIDEYESFARELIEVIPDRSISFEVFSDDFDDMAAQAQEIASWGDNVYVKVPVTNTRGASASDLIRRLATEEVKLNVTALMTVRQVETVAAALADGPSSYVSVFAGRIADTGRDPLPIMAAALDVLRGQEQLELVWASPREILNVVQADAIGCHIITVTHDLLTKLPLLGRDLDAFSLDTVRMFHDDAKAAAYRIALRGMPDVGDVARAGTR